MVKKFIRLSARRTEAQRRTLDAWFRETEKSQQPYLVVWDSARYAVVEWDYIALNEDAKARIHDNAAAIEAFQRELVAQYVRRGKASCIISPAVAFFYHVERAEAAELATRLHDFLAHILVTGQAPAAE